MGPDIQTELRGAAGESGEKFASPADYFFAAPDAPPQSLLAAAVAASEDAIVTSTTDGVITSWNRAAERLFGFAAGEAVGQSIRLIVPAELQREDQRVVIHLRNGGRSGAFDTTRKHRNGSLIEVSLTLSPIYDSAGVMIGVSRIARDIGQRKRTEAELREFNRRKDEFLAILSHELRNPLAPMFAALDLLRKNPAPEQLAWMTDVFDRQIRHMVALIDELLDVSRINAGTIVLSKERIDLQEVVNAAIETTQPAVARRSHALRLENAAQPLYVEADRVRLTQVLGNVLHNAAKFTPKGGQICVRVERQENEAVVEVRDNGIGIAADKLTSIFKLYAQAGDALGVPHGGLGLGLAIASTLMKLHGGSLCACSEGPGRGSTFVARLPLAAQVG